MKVFLSQRIIMYMNYDEQELRVIELKERVIRSVEELIQELIDVDENDDESLLNEVSISDGKGGRITLSSKKDIKKR